jgi:hypothetical protein
MPEHLRDRLRAHYKGHDARLADLLGRQPGWLA